MSDARKSTQNQTLEARAGRLYDLGPDGLGFIIDDADQNVWSFQYYRVGLSLAHTVDRFVALEGKQVRFWVSDGQVRSLALQVQAPVPAVAAGV